MKYINALELKSKLDKGDSLTILDIREPYEYAICSIGGLEIPMGDVEARIAEIPTENDLIILCRSGKRAVAVANLLMTDHSLSNVVILEGGILNWIENVDSTLEAY